jgi:hypothetical protein
MSLAPRDEPERALRPSAFARPGLLLLVALYRLVAGLLIAAPVASLFNVTVSGYPRGDAELFDPGGIMLLEALRLGLRAMPPTLIAAGLPALVALVVGLVPLAMLIAGLGRRGPLPRAFLARAAFDRLGTLTLLWGSTALAQVVLVVLVALLGGKLIDTLRLAPKGGDLAFLAVGAVAALLVVIAGVVRDLAAVAAVDDRERFYLSVARALRTLVRRPARVLAAYGARALLGLALLAAAFELAPPAGGSLALAFALHEGAILAGVVLRASWLAAAIRLLAETAPRHQPAPAPASRPVVESAPSVAAEEAPSVAVEEAPSVAVEDAPSVVVEEAPSVVVEEAPSVAVEEAPSVAVEEAASPSANEAPSEAEPPSSSR